MLVEYRIQNVGSVWNLNSNEFHWNADTWRLNFSIFLRSTNHHLIELKSIDRITFLLLTFYFFFVDVFPLQFIQSKRLYWFWFEKLLHHTKAFLLVRCFLFFFFLLSFVIPPSERVHKLLRVDIVCHFISRNSANIYFPRFLWFFSPIESNENCLHDWKLKKKSRKKQTRRDIGLELSITIKHRVNVFSIKKIAIFLFTSDSKFHRDINYADEVRIINEPIAKFLIREGKISTKIYRTHKHCPVPVFSNRHPCDGIRDRKSIDRKYHG